MSVLTWLATPVLFTAAVLGLMGFGRVLLDADWRVALSSALFGSAAAVTALLAPVVEWRTRRCRWCIGVGYPALVFVAGLMLGDVTLAAPVALVVGVPALIVLAVLIRRERNRVIPIA
jgi:hypothetical protein